MFKETVKMRILIIGGNGFFGRRLAARLLQDEEVSSVVSMDLTPPKEIFTKSIEKHSNKYHFVRGDVSQLEDILNAIKSFSVTKVVNFAYLLTLETENMPRACASVNVLGMCNVFEAARLLDLSRVVYASSFAVYGPQSEYGDRDVTEDDHLHPSITYGITKQINERMAASYSEQYGMSIVGLRPSHGFGHGRESAGVANRFSSIVSLPAVGKPAFIEVEGSSAYSIVGAEDIAELTRILLYAPSPSYPIYNVAGQPVSLEQIVNQVRQYIPDAKIEFGHESGDLNLSEKISCERAGKEFGFSPRPLAELVLHSINEARIEVGLAPIKS